MEYYTGSRPTNNNNDNNNLNNNNNNLDDNQNKISKSKSTEELEEPKEEKEQNSTFAPKENFQPDVNTKDQNVFESALKNKQSQNLETNLNSKNLLAQAPTTKNFTLFSQEMIESLENYFIVLKKNENLKEKSVLFFDLYEKHIENKDFIFMLFWFPFIKSDELLSVEILNTTKVYMGERVIESIFTISISSKDLNNYAFQLAVENKFNESLLLIIIKQGKIKLPLEWLFEQVKIKAVNLLEDCWLAANDCFFETQTFSGKFFDFYKQSLNINLVDNGINNNNKAAVSFGKKLLGASMRKLDSSNNFDGSNFLGGSNNNNNTEKAFAAGPPSGGFTPAMQKEYIELFSKNSGKLTISKLILLANLHLNSTKINIDNNINNNAEKEAILNLIRAICIFDKEKKFSRDILEGLFITRNKAIAAELLEANLLNVNISVFQTSLYFQDLRFCLQFYQTYSDFKIFDKESLHDEIIQKIFEDLNNMEVYLFFIKSFSSDFRLNTVKTLVKIVEDLLQVSNQSNRIMNNFSNPIKIFVLIAEILNRIKSKFPSLDSNIQRIIQKCLDYSENIQVLIEDDSVFRELLLERDLTKRSVLDIISQNNFLILLKNKLIEKIVDDLWDGPYDIQGSFLEVSSQYRSLTVNTDSKDYDIYTKQRVGILSKKTKSFKSNFTHFNVWQRNIYSKYFVEILIGFILILFGQIISIFYINEYKGILEFDNVQLANYSEFLLSLQKTQFDKGKLFIKDNDALLGNSTVQLALQMQNYNASYADSDLFQAALESVLEDANKDAFKEMLNNYNIDLVLIKNLLGSKTLFNAFYSKVSSMQTWMNYLDMLFWFYLLLPFDYFMRLIYMMKARKPNLGLTLFPDLGLILFGVIMKIVTLDSNNLIKSILSNLSFDSINEFNYFPYLKLLEDFVNTDPFNYQLLALAIMCGLLWLRFILQIRGTKTFGPIIVIFLVSLKGVAKYVALFLIITFAYSCCAYMVFYRIKGYYYKNPFYCFIYFFALSLGGDIAYDSYSVLSSEKPYIPFLGGIFIVTVLILNVIVFFNLIIALLSNIFETYKNYSLQLYIQKKLDIRKKYYDDDERFNSLLVSYFPFNILTFPFGLALLFMSDKTRTKKLNKLIMYINYSFYAFFYTICFTLFTLVLLPLTFVKICYSKFVQIFVDEIQQYFKAFKIISFIFYIIFGLFFQLKSFAYDVVFFFKELWKKQIPLTIATENIGKYSIKTELLKIIVRMVKKTGKAVNANLTNNNNNNANNNNGYNLTGNLSPSGLNLNSNNNNNNINNTNNNNNNALPESSSNPQHLKVSLEKFLFLLAKQLDPNAEKKYKENLNIYDYSVEKEASGLKAPALLSMLSGNDLAEDASANNLIAENGFNFNSNYLSYSPIFQRQGFNYSDVLDYLFNFCDEKYHLDIPTLINIVTTGLKIYEIRLFYANISDKNYKNYTAKKQQIFFEKIDTVMRKETKLVKKKTQKLTAFAVKTLKTLKTVKTLKDAERNEKAYKESFSQQMTSNVADFTETKVLNDNNLKYLNNQNSESNLNNGFNLAGNNANNANINANNNKNKNKNNNSNAINRVNSNIYNVISNNNNNLYSNNLNSNNFVNNNNGNTDNLDEIVVESLQPKKTGLKFEIKRVFSKFLPGKRKSGEKNYLKKIERSKNFFALPDTLSIALITRACVVSFYNDLKEYQNDLSKKIAENILKNQKYLEEILSDNKKMNYNNNNTNTNKPGKEKSGSKGMLGGYLNKMKEKEKKTAISDRKISKNNENSYPVSKPEENKNKFNNKNNNNNITDPYLKNENLDKSVIDNFEIRINNLEDKMERLIFMTEKIFNVIEKRSAGENYGNNSQDESIDGSYVKEEAESNRSASTMKIEKFYGQMNFEEFET